MGNSERKLGRLGHILQLGGVWQGDGLTGFIGDLGKQLCGWQGLGASSASGLSQVSAAQMGRLLALQASLCACLVEHTTVHTHV